MMGMGHLRIGHLIIAGLVIFGEVACQILPASDTSGPPDWVNSESSRYPREKYLTGVGYGNERKTAENEAYAAISKIFQASIRSKTQEWEEYLQSSGTGRGSKNGEVVSRKILMDQLTQVSTAMAIKDVFIAEVWVGPRDQQTYALAVMDRAHAASLIQERIEDLDHKALTLFESATAGAGSRLQVARDLHAAFNALLVREGLNTDLKIIRPDGHGIESQLSLNRVGPMLRQALSDDFHVTLELSGFYLKEIRAAVLKGITRKGLVITDTSGSIGEKGEVVEDVLIEGQLELEPVQLQGKYFFRWRVQFTLIDRSNGGVFGNMVRNGREGHLNEKEAEARAVRAAQQVVQEEVGPALADMILGEETELQRTEIP